MDNRSYPFLPVFLLWLVLGGLSCRKEETIQPGFDMVFSQQFSIPAGLNPFLVHHFYFRNLNTQFGSLLLQHNKTTDAVKQVLPTQIELTGIFGDENFDFIEEATLFVYREDEPTARLEMGYRFPVPLRPGNSLPLIPGLADVKKFMSQDRVSFDLALRLRTTTPDESPSRLDIRLRAHY